ncbi:MAG: hypothetical protein V1874_16290 [Spirochaetota bacterium]
MKIKKSSIVFCIVIFAAALCFSYIACGGDGGKWVAKIKGDEITLGQLNSLYYAQQKSLYNDATNAEIDKRAENPEELSKNPTLDKKEFLENVIRQRLVYNKAIEDGIQKNKELEALIQMAKEAVVVGFYVKEKFKDQINVTDQEIAKIYSDQRARFKGAPIDQAEQYIRQQMMQQKLQMKLREFVEALKEEGGIKRNLDVLAKKDDFSKKENKDNAVKKEAAPDKDKKDAAVKAVKEPVKEVAPVKVEPKK